MAELSLARIFSEPDINGPLPVAVKTSPGGNLVTYLQALPEDTATLHLFGFDPDSGTSRLLVDAREIGTLTTGLSDEEKAERERRRISHGGIVDYHWAPDGTWILLPVHGSLYRYHTASGSLDTVLADAGYAVQVRFSPCGSWLSMVIAGDLWLLDIASGTRQQLTFDASDTVSNGLPEFIAQEEMHRFEGYWWSPDSAHIAFFQVDESAVDITQRYEIDADDFRIFPQRYPYAGANNAQARLGVINIGSGDVTFPGIESADGYLARLNWRDSGEVLVQVQDRAQMHLDIIALDLASGNERTLVRESGTAWVDLHDDLRVIPDSRDFLWRSSRDGFPHLYRYCEDTGALRQLTHGNWCTAGIRSVRSDSVLFEGCRDTPLERQLYRLDLATGDLEQLTSSGAWHNTVVGEDHFIDRRSSVDEPPSLWVVAVDDQAAIPLNRNELSADHPMAGHVKAGAVTFGELSSDDGQTLHYRLVPPDNRQPGQRYPIVVTVYGGPGAQLVTNQWLSPWQRYMASQGYGLFQLDNRGSANRGVRFETSIKGQLGDVEVADQVRGVRFLHTLDWVDPERIGVFGHSYGGYMTLMMMMKAPALFRAGISVAPVSDWHLYDTHYTERYLGLPAENPSGYEQSSVFPFVNQLKGQLLLIHGMADDNVLYTHSTRLYKALQDANLPFEVMAYPGAKHGLTGRSVNLHRYALMDRFFANHLGGHGT